MEIQSEIVTLKHLRKVIGHSDQGALASREVALAAIEQMDSLRDSTDLSAAKALLAEIVADAKIPAQVRCQAARMEIEAKLQSLR